ncbi:3'-5' exonuclease [Kaistella palustris]|uniref:3'-5' exonuclease n=1 Tax=Kaistella palustris TaxID=493376 RepID=UPI0003F66BC0|nr:3'-5' exonuclease [Kaistella palustris]
MYAVIDIESNGAGFRKESIIEIAIYKYDGHEIVDQFSSLVNPDSEITQFVQKLTNISPKMVRTAPRFHEIAKRVVEITEGTTLVGHNIDFDYRMLRQEFKRLGYEFTINTLDTIPLAKKLLPEAESYSLGKLVKSLGIPLVDQHRAGGDAKATLELFKLLMIKDQDSEIIQQHHQESNAKTYLNKVRNVTRDLPFERGIIYFQNAAGKIIYHDFVEDLSKFAKSVFNSKSKRWQQIQQETEHISYELTGNDILAKLMMKTKGLDKRYHLPYGLYFHKDKFRVEKVNLLSDKPLIKFSSFTQGLKAISFIKTQPHLDTLEKLTTVISLKNRNELWLSTGRTLGEKSFLILQNGTLTSYGFYELHTQINSQEKLNKIKIDLKSCASYLQNDLALSLLRGDFDIQPLPQ